MKESEVCITIDVNEDFDGWELQNTIENTGDSRAKRILTIIFNKWVNEIGHPEWSKPV